MTTRKKKVSTFEQLMKAKQIADAKYKIYDKADDKYRDLVWDFPECTNKLFEFEGKTYVVNQSRRPNGSPQLDIIEVET